MDGRLASNKWLVLLMLLGLVLVCYWNIAQSYFLSADFFQIPYVYEHLRTNPLTLFKSFTDTWTENRHHSLYYRPLMPLAFIFDCALWGNNALGYHASNIALHLVCSFLLYLLGARLLKGTFSNRAKEIAAFAAAVFAVHPIHTGSVSWISGRVDLFCTAFMYLSFYLVLGSSSKRSSNTCPGGVASYAVAQLFKESAASLPLTLILYDVLVGGTSLKMRKRFTDALVGTKWFWAVLFTYLAIRTCVLGTVTGGFAGSFGEARLQNILFWWVEQGSLLRLLLPCPYDFGGGWVWAAACLSLLYLAAIALAGAGLAAVREPFAVLRITFFLVAWSVLSIVPTLFAWHLTAALVGGHLVYQASGPLCLLLSVIVFSACYLSDPAKLASKFKTMLFSASLARGVMVCFVGVFALITFFLNGYRSDASLDSLALATQIEELVEGLPAGQKIVLINPPKSSHGMFLFPNCPSLSGTLKPPFCPTDLSSKLIYLDHFMQYSEIINVSHLKRLLSVGNSCVPYMWDGARLRLVRCYLSDFSQTLERLPQAGQIGKKEQISSAEEMYPITLSPPSAVLAADYVDVTFKTPKMRATDIDIDIAADTDTNTNTGAGAGQEIESQDPQALLRLSWAQDSSTASDDIDATMQPPKNTLTQLLICDGKPHVYRFQVSQYKRWLTTQQVYELRISDNVPSSQAAGDNLMAVTLGGLEHAQPVLSPDEAAFEQRSDGSYERKGGAPLRFYFDASKIAGVEAVAIEISRPDHWFELQDDGFRDSKLCTDALLRKHLATKNGAFELQAGDFPISAYYDVRIGGLDKEGKIVFYFSDPVSIYVTKP